MRAQTITIVLLALTAAACVNWVPSERSERKNPTAPPPINSAAQDCDPNYSGCVPIASDVDCAGGPGNGPAYVKGPIRVIGEDIYDLDRDNDGVACE